jgi:hypothetical protein
VLLCSANANDQKKLYNKPSTVSQSTGRSRRSDRSRLSGVFDETDRFGRAGDGDPRLSQNRVKRQMICAIPDRLHQKDFKIVRICKFRGEFYLGALFQLRNKIIERWVTLAVFTCCFHNPSPNLFV